jgi:hypothetical protein
MKFRILIPVLAGLGLSSAAPQSGSEGIAWAHSWAEAVEEARIRNVPIVFSLHKDG